MQSKYFKTRKKYRQSHKDERKLYNIKYFSQQENVDRSNSRYQKYRDELTDSYLVVYLSRKYDVPSEVIKQNKELIELEKARILLWRKLREIKRCKTKS